MKKRSTEKEKKNNLKLVKIYNNYGKKGITLINIVVLLFCILIIYSFNNVNNISKNILNIGSIKNILNTNEQQNNSNNNTNTNTNNNNTDELVSKRQILEEKIKKEITEKMNISQDINTTFTEVVSLQNKIAENDLEISKLDIEFKELEEKIRPLKQEELRLKDIKNKQETLAKTRLKYMYMNGQFKTLEVILKSKNLLEMFSNYYMLQEINGMDVKLLESLDKDRKRLEVITRDLKEYEVLEKEKMDTEKQIAEKSRYIKRIPKYVGGTLMWPVPTSNSTRWITAFFGAGASQGYPRK